MLYFLFFCSGISGLIYQVVWVRVFANVFGNTIYSASMVVAVFMLGLGTGSYVAGWWADRRYAERPDSLLPAFGVVEFAIGILGLAISLVLPHLGDLSAAVSSYARGADGWYVLSTASYVARGAIVVATILPVTLFMGGTLTLLIRHVVRIDVNADSSRIALLYGINTLGAAVGCLLTDYALVPSFGLRATQMLAVSLNLATAFGALALARARVGAKSQIPNPKPQIPTKTEQPRARSPKSDAPIMPTALALALTGFAAMGMEIVWFRHFSILLGEFRAVFSLLLAVILLGLGAGALAGGYAQRRVANPAVCFAFVEAVFIAVTLAGLAIADARAINAAALAYAATHAAADRGIGRDAAELWFNARPILTVVGLPAVAMGFAFPLANAMIQRAEASVGRRAGLLYLSNTIGAVCGSLAAGFVLLPVLGIQHSASVLMVVAACAILALQVRLKQPSFGRTVAASLLIAIGALAWWLLLPSDYVLSRALLFPMQRAYTVSEGVTELIAVTDGPDGGRVLVTNGHPMSSTELMSQRYMRAMAHVPLLLMDSPTRVLVICYGVGNTANAATLHPSVTRVDIVDLSRHVLDQSDYFKAFNGDVLHDPRVSVYVNDGRQHLQMQPSATYDLITLEPPPIMHAGVAALYTTEFYERAKQRLTPNGYLTQWLPAFGVPQSMILSMARSFVDVFPHAVLLSGASSNLLLVGTNNARNEIDPDRLAAALAHAPAVRADLQRVDLGTPRDIVGMFVASSRTLALATRQSAPVTDDHPIQEYGKKSLLDVDEGVPPALVDLSDVSSWCPRCFVNGMPARPVAGLDTYLALLNLAYTAPRVGVGETVPENASREPIAGSGYLGAVVPESAQLDALLDRIFTERYQQATDLLVAKRYDAAIDEFREALKWKDRSAPAHNNLGIALASTGLLDEAIDQFKQALAIDPGFDDAVRNLEFATAPRRPARRASAAIP